MQRAAFSSSPATSNTPATPGAASPTSPQTPTVGGPGSPAFSIPPQSKKRSLSSALASPNADSPITSARPSSNKRRRIDNYTDNIQSSAVSSGPDSPYGQQQQEAGVETDSTDLERIRAALDEEKRLRAIEKLGREAGETNWVLSTIANGQGSAVTGTNGASGPSGPRGEGGGALGGVGSRVQRAGYADIDDGGDGGGEGSEDLAPRRSWGLVEGRMRFGKGWKVERRRSKPVRVRLPCV